MIVVLDGPAAGREFTARRAPVYLRFVKAAVWDVLDQPDDEPRPGERVYVYRIVNGTWSRVFVRPGGCYESGEYAYVHEQPEQAMLCDTALWRQWAEGQP